jgi:peptidyl-prolyl cis-trans isomerase SurA
MKIYLKSLLLLLFSITTVVSALAQESKNTTDKIVAIVNDRIVLKSDVDAEVMNYLRQAELENADVTFSEELWYSALQSMVDNYVLLEKAKIDSVIVGDDMVNRQMDMRINEMVRQAGSERALERAFDKSLIQIRADFREQFREQLTANQVQQLKIDEINITRPEVEEFFNSIPESQIPTVPEQVGVSQIVSIPPPLEDAKNEAFELANAIRDSIVNHGKNFEEMARKYSEDGSSRRGGLLPLMPMDDLVANYSAAASALEEGGISEVVETQFGFHVIRLNQRVGDNIETNHILIKMDDGQIDEQYAIDRLTAIRDSVINHDKNFADMARQYSEDEATKSFGGRIVDNQTGRRLIPINQLEPSLYRIVLLLEEQGEISEPRPYNPSQQDVSRAFRIVRLDRHIPEHTANLDQDYDRIEQLALQQKQTRIMSKWIDDLREEVYVEFKIPIPEEVSGDLI